MELGGGGKAGGEGEGMGGGGKEKKGAQDEAGRENGNVDKSAKGRGTQKEMKEMECRRVRRKRR